MEVADECVTLCGGVGYMRDFPVEKYMRDAKVTQIYEGTVHIQKNEIVAALMKEYASGATPASNPPAENTVPLKDLLHSYQKKAASSAPQGNKEPALSQAEVIVAGGRGVGSAQGFKLLEKLALRLGGTVAGTRPAADNGWISTERQIGITGKTVKPKLYIACGISGQLHHMAGLGKADTLVAINKDPHAPIMKMAHYAVEGDLYEVIPAILEKLK